MPVSPVSAAYNQCVVHPCSECSKQQHQQQQQMHYQIPYLTSPSCSLHPKPGGHSSPSSVPPPPAPYGYTPIPHSKSLDQYDPNGLINVPNVPHRHSFDQFGSSGNNATTGHLPPIPSYDCIDGAHASCNYTAFNSHPYNVSGNRFPLPYNLSNSLNNGGYAVPNGHLNKGYAVPNNCYAPNMAAPPPPPPPAKMIHPDEYYTTRTSGYYSGIPQVQPDPIIPHDVSGSGGHNNKYTSIASQANVGTLIDLDTKPTFPTSILKKDTRHSQHITSSSNKRYKDLLSGGGGDVLVPSNFEKTSRHSDFDSYDDDLSKSTPKSSSQATKNQDGIGSYESWNYVFKNLEKQGYNKDLGTQRHENDTEDDDLGLDIDRLNLQLVDPIPPPIIERSTKVTAAASAHVRNCSNSNSSNVMKAPELPNKPSALATKSSNKSTSAMTNNHHHHHQAKTTIKQPNGSIKHKAPLATPPSLPSPVNNEWSCRFCTFLNHESKRICEMCAKSRDFNLDAAGKTSTATCV